MSLHAAIDVAPPGDPPSSEASATDAVHCSGVRQRRIEPLAEGRPSEEGELELACARMSGQDDHSEYVMDSHDSIGGSIGRGAAPRAHWRRRRSSTDSPRGAHADVAPCDVSAAEWATPQHDDPSLSSREASTSVGSLAASGASVAAPVPRSADAALAAPTALPAK